MAYFSNVPQALLTFITQYNFIIYNYPRNCANVFIVTRNNVMVCSDNNYILSDPRKRVFFKILCARAC